MSSAANRDMSQHSHTRPLIVVDGDDTLWATQELYESAKERLFSVLGDLGWTRDLAAARFSAVDVENVSRMGLSRERFPMSMRETYEEACLSAGRRPEAAMVELVTEIGRAVFDAVPSVYADASDALARLGRECQLILFTAGDESVQTKRIEESHLRSYFSAVRITPIKNLKSWSVLQDSEGLTRGRDWSIGNSIRSDINPAVELGLNAVHVLRETWAYEASAAVDPGRPIWTAESLAIAADTVLAALAEARGQASEWAR